MTARRVLLAAGLVALAACTIEPRADTRGASSSDSLPDSAVSDAAGSGGVSEVLAALAEALSVGDAARVAALGTADLSLVDQEEGVFWTARDPASPLPGALLAGGDRAGLDWTLTDQRVTPVGDGRLVVRRYRAEIAGEAVAWWAVETVVLMREGDLWKVRHLHRSRGAEGGEGGP